METHLPPIFRTIQHLKNNPCQKKKQHNLAKIPVFFILIFPKKVQCIKLINQSEIKQIYAKFLNTNDLAQKFNLLQNIVILLENSVQNVKQFLDLLINNKWLIFQDPIFMQKSLEIIQILVEKTLSGFKLKSNNDENDPNLTNNKKNTYFTKNEGLALLNNDLILKILSENMKSECPQKEIILEILSNLCRLAHLYKKRQIYDQLAEKLQVYKIYESIIKMMQNSEALTKNEEKFSIRIFELAATIHSGVLILNENLEFVLTRLCKIFANSSIPNEIPPDLLYSAVTVLLDLTANEICIERCAKFLHISGMFSFIFQEAKLAFSRKYDSHCTNPVKSTKYKDLLIGIILNLACNVESEKIQGFFIENGVVDILVEVLFDQRNDWPSNGSALALLQYSHKSITNLAIYAKISSEKLRSLMREYIKNEKATLESRKNIIEANTLLEIAEKKQKSVINIINKLSLAAAA